MLNTRFSVAVITITYSPTVVKTYQFCWPFWRGEWWAKKLDLFLNSDAVSHISDPDFVSELPPQSTSVRTPAISTSNRRLGSTRAGSVETLNLLSSSSSSSHQRSRTPDFLKPLSKETEIYKSNHKARETKGEGICSIWEWMHFCEVDRWRR